MKIGKSVKIATVLDVNLKGEIQKNTNLKGEIEKNISL
jgi:hypothetical protein